MHFCLRVVRESYAAHTESIALDNGTLVLLLRVEATQGRQHLVDLHQAVHQEVRRVKDTWREKMGDVPASLVIEKVGGGAHRFDILYSDRPVHVASQLDRQGVVSAFDGDPVLTEKLDALSASLYPGKAP